eukprot:CAMPEP_0118868108 /NCGR_PEP_ID=MMETSP1163-20130328/11569_1 /TAXON_ID=124430 /ORGANISM="Phaeomonas parva, Strain CCMP2877" /LENGTH=1011 /DNA_ID=CAMNT_0006802679 /DNA_START=153 /DNA_END=3188 /DNA_ORIENTATION=-
MDDGAEEVSISDLVGRMLTSDPSMTTDDASSGITNLIRVVLAHVGPGAEFAVDDVTAVSDPEIFERIAENVERLMANENQGDLGEVASLRAQLSALAVAAREQQDRYALMLASTDNDLAKPQLSFPAGVVDNARASLFRPSVAEERLVMDPDPGRDFPGYVHPFEREIMQLGYAASQLQPDPNPNPNPRPAPLDLGAVAMVNTPAALEAMVGEVLARAGDGRAAEIAVGLQHHAYRSFRGLLCIMQISSRERNYIVDMLALKDQLGPLGGLFMNENVVKVVHGADHHALWLQRDAGLYLVNYFDTAIAAKMLKYESPSLAHVLQRHGGVALDKQLSLSDWRVRPLPDTMLGYAAACTHHLLFAYDRMREELHARGSASAVQSVMEASKEVALRRYEHERFNPHGYKPLLKKLPAPATPAEKDWQERSLSALWDWRDAVARFEDESVGYTASIANLVSLGGVFGRRQPAGAGVSMLEDVTADDVVAAVAENPNPLVAKHAAALAKLLNAAARGADADLAAVLQSYALESVGGAEGLLEETYKTPSRRRSSQSNDPDVEDELREVHIMPVPGGSGARPPRAGSATGYGPASTPVPILTASNIAELSKFRTSTSPFVFTPPPIGPSFEKSFSYDGTSSPTLRMTQPSPVLGTAALYSQAGWSIQVEADSKSNADSDGREGFLIGDADAADVGVGERKAEEVRRELNRRPLFSLSVADFLEESAETDTKNILEAVLGSIVNEAEEEEPGDTKAEGESSVTAGEDTAIPQSLEEIYHVSNRNRKRNKDKKKLKYMTQEEAQVFLARRGPAEGGVRGAQASDIVREMSSEKRIVANKEDTINFMEAIGWINIEQRDSLRETYILNAHGGAGGGGGGGGGGPNPNANQGGGGGGQGGGYNPRGGRHPNANPNAKHMGGGGPQQAYGQHPNPNPNSRYDRTLAAIGAFGGANPNSQVGNTHSHAKAKGGPGANPFLPQQGFQRGGHGGRGGGPKPNHRGPQGGRRNLKEGRSMSYKSYH